MTKQVQRRRGTAAQHTSFTGAEGEISVNTTNKSVHVHDGVTAGGVEAARADLNNVSDANLNAALSGNTLASLTITSADINGGTIDGTVIGGSTPAAISGTTGQFGTSLNVDGTVTADGLTVDGNGLIRANNAGITDPLSVNNRIRFEDIDPTKINSQQSGTIEWYTNDADNVGVQAYISAQSGNTGTGTLHFATGTGGSPLQRMVLDTNGDISFYEDTGTTPKFFWDASAESLGIGTTSPANELHVNGGSSTTVRISTSSTTAEPKVVFTDGSGDYASIEKVNRDVKIKAFNTDVAYFTSSGNVGIGTSSPSFISTYGGLQVNGSNGTTIKLTNPTTGATSTDGFELILQAGGLEAYVWQRESSSLIFGTSATERMRIDSSGSLTVGGQSATRLEVNLTENDKVELNVVDSTNTARNFAFSTGDTERMRITSTGACEWRPNGTTQAMTLDSSGNLLVGKTVNDNTTEGAVVRETGEASFTTTSNRAAIFNRLTSDGEIIGIRKDGTTVGSIASRAGVVSTLILDPRTPSAGAGAGIGTTTSKIVPADTSGLTDARNDLGDSGNRWKDLYLSGGVYLGGTGAANKLDDYEQGTFNVQLWAGGTQLTLSEFGGSYVKIGNLVTVNFEADCSNTNGASGVLEVRGMPFTIADVISPTGIEANGSIAYWQGWATTINSPSLYAEGNTTVLYVMGSTSSTVASNSNLTAANIGTGEFRGTITYRTT